MWCVKRTLFCVFLITSCLQLLQCQQFAGDECYHEVKEAKGICKVIKDCQSSVLDLRNKINPQNCGFQGFLPVVCCVEVAPTPPPLPQPPGVRSLQKCEEYRRYSFVEVISPTLTHKVVSVLQSECPFDKIKLIIGGERAKENEFPHMALIGFNNGDKIAWDCGGSLISENYVLTAAHCLYTASYGSATVVRLGEMNVNDPSDDANVQDIRIKKQIPHPEYARPSGYNDIALLLLETSPKLGIAVRPACLFTERRSETKSAIATGWGYTQVAVARSDWLMKVILEFFTAKRCNVTYSKDQVSLKKGIDDESQVCAGSYDEEKDTCQGDSGGPLQLYSNVSCMYDIMAVTSLGQNCGFIGIPAVYTRVYPYLKWIEDIVWP